MNVCIGYFVVSNVLGIMYFSERLNTSVYNCFTTLLVDSCSIIPVRIPAANNTVSSIKYLLF